MKAQRNGFTLLELMIVVAIIAVLTAIAIPNLSQSKIASNEASAQRSLVAICTAQAIYHRKFGRYTENFVNLHTAALLVQSDLHLADASGGVGSARAKSGYVFASNQNVGDEDFMVVAAPVRAGVTGEFMMFTNVNSIVYRLAIEKGSDIDDAISEWTDDEEDWDPAQWESVPN